MKANEVLCLKMMMMQNVGDNDDGDDDNTWQFI